MHCTTHGFYLFHASAQKLSLFSLVFDFFSIRPSSACRANMFPTYQGGNLFGKRGLMSFQQNIMFKEKKKIIFFVQRSAQYLHKELPIRVAHR